MILLSMDGSMGGLFWLVKGCCLEKQGLTMQGGLLENLGKAAASGMTLMPRRYCTGVQPGPPTTPSLAIIPFVNE